MQCSGVAEVDLLAEQMYSSLDPLARQQAQASLEALTKEDADSVFHYTILQQSNNQYTLLFMAQGLVLWFRSARKWMSEEQKRELIVVHCGGCLKRVFDNGAPKHVVSSLLTSYAKLTKLAFESEPFLEAAVDFPLEMLIQEPEGSSLRLLSLMLLNTLLLEFTKYDCSKSQIYLTFLSHRHCSGNFKDRCLLKIFLTALKKLEVVTANSPHIEEEVKLVENCLSYDFRAIIVDETEEMCFVQFPSSWKSTLLNEQNLRILWGQHAALPYPHSANLFSGLMSVCGVQRTFFDSAEERVQYLQFSLSRLAEVAMMEDGRLKIPRYVELLAEAYRRVLLSFGYRELYSLDAFEPWVNAFSMLSMRVLLTPFGQEGSLATANSVLGFWVSLTTSKRRSLIEQNRRDIEDIVVRLLQAFLKARIHNSDVDEVGPLLLNDDNGENVTELVLVQSDAYASICLLDPAVCLNDLANYLNQQVGMSILSSPSSTAWLFYLAGSIARLVLFNMEESGIDSCSHVFAYVTGCANHRLRRDGDPAMFGAFVERGVLYFLANVQMVLTGTRHGNLSTVVVNVFQSPTRLFQFVLDNAGHNLLRGADDAESAHIIRLSADVIADACRDAPPYLLQELSFDLPPPAELPLAQSERTYKLRTNLMKTLWFLGRTGPCTAERMESYLSNIETNMQRIASKEVTNPSFVAGWLRDLRGACQALSEEETLFGDFLEWFCRHSHVFLSVVDSGAESSVVVTALMRFLCELVTNGRCGRLNVPSSSNSAVGLMLFKSLCTLIEKVEEVTFSDYHVAALSGLSTEYDKTLKPWMLSMEIMKKCVQGSFVSFGAMLFYNDKTFENCALSLVRKLTHVGPNVFKEHVKFTAMALDLLRLLTEENLYFPLRHLKSDELVALVGTVILICEDVDTTSGVLLYGLSFLAFIAGLVQEVKAIVLTPMLLPTEGNTPPPPAPPLLHEFVPNINVSMTSPRGCQSRRLPRFAQEVREQLARLLAPHQDLWQRLISLAMNIITFRDRAVSASSAVVYPIFEAHPPFWFGFVEQFVASYPEQQQAGVREALSLLTNASDSKEKFFSEVFSFRQAIRRVSA